ncbi:MAG: diaminopimelate epimerase [Rudaea sp.]
MALRFSKMHGAGNDFVVIDSRAQPFVLAPERIAQIGDRHRGIGFDQLLTIEPARDASCAFHYGIYNSDGSTSGQCGNGVRCVATWLRRAGALDAGRTRLESPSGPVEVELLDDGRVRVNMGEPRFDPRDVTLNMPAADPYAIDIEGRSLEFGAVSMGNPHAVVEVADVDAAIGSLGRVLSSRAEFQAGCNAGFVAVWDRAHLMLRVWERGAGATLACGTGACAAVAVLHRRGRLDDTVAVALPGGTLEIHWQGAGHDLWMTGPAAFVYEGEIDE